MWSNKHHSPRHVPLLEIRLIISIENVDILYYLICFFFFQAEDGIRDRTVTGVQTCALPILIDLDEHETASLEERLRAAHRCQESGYRLGFHFDPIVEYPGWEKDYEAMLEQTFATIEWRRIAWLSMGVLRNTPGLKRIMRARFPQTQLLTGEQVLCPDGKLRYFQPLRVEIYRKMLRWIRRAAPTVKVYLCMESKEVWEQVFGYAPSCEKELGNQIANFGF